MRNFQMKLLNWWQKLNKGRPKILTTRKECKIIRTFLMLRETLSLFNITRLKLESGLMYQTIQSYVSWNATNTIIYNHEKKIWCQDTMPEYDYFFEEKWYVFFLGTFGLIISVFVLMKPHKLTELIHLTMELPWCDHVMVWHWDAPQKERKRALGVKWWKCL